MHVSVMSKSKVKVSVNLFAPPVSLSNISQQKKCSLGRTSSLFLFL